MIERSKRVITDKATDVENPIDKVQYAVINQRFRRASKVIIVPTNIKNPKRVSLFALSASANAVLKDNFYTDLVLHYATNSTVSAVLGIPGTNTACKQDQLLISGRKLYIAKQDVPASYWASPSITPGSNSYWKRLEDFGSNAQTYLLVTTRASTATWANVKLGVEVRGY